MHLRTSLVLMIASPVKTRLTNVFHSFVRTGRSDQPVSPKLNASVLSNRELFVVKLTLLWMDNKFGHVMPSSPS